MEKEKFNITNLVNNDGCFDLQFRKDIRRERTNSPTYYRWKAQFVVTVPKENVKVLERVKKIIGCGSVSITRGQARFSVQNVNDISEVIVPFFRKNKLIDKKKKDFALWQKAVDIIYNNKGKHIVAWKKNDLLSLVQIHESVAKYKHKPRQAKWIGMAKSMTQSA